MTCVCTILSFYGAYKTSLLLIGKRSHVVAAVGSSLAICMVFTIHLMPYNRVECIFPSFHRDLYSKYLLTDLAVVCLVVMWLPATLRSGRKECNGTTRSC